MLVQCPRDPDEAEDWELLKVAVALTLDHASQEATDCRRARVLFVMAASMLLFPQEESAEVVAKEIHYYPDYGDMRKVRPSVRSTEEFLGGVAEHTPTLLDFAPKFWLQCMRETTCVAEPLPVGNEMVSAGTTLERVDDIYSKLVEHAGATRNTKAVDARHEAVFGIGL
jgi:hypothetical protein